MGKVRTREWVVNRSIGEKGSTKSGSERKGERDL